MFFVGNWDHIMLMDLGLKKRKHIKSHNYVDDSVFQRHVFQSHLICTRASIEIPLVNGRT